jgi:hypothetical protein
MTALRSTEKETDYCSKHPGGGLCRKFLGKGKGKNDGENENESKNLEDKWAKRALGLIFTSNRNPKKIIKAEIGIACSVEPWKKASQAALMISPLSM